MRDAFDRRSPSVIGGASVRRLAWAALALCATALGSCRRSPEADLDRAHLLVPPASFQILDLDQLNRIETLAATSFTDGDGSAWSRRGGSRTEKGLCTSDHGNPMELELRSDEASVRATHLEVVARELEALFVELRWIPAGPGRAAYRKKIFKVQAAGSGRDHYRFDLSQVPARAIGDTVVLAIPNSPSVLPCIAAVSWLNVRVDPSKIAAAAERPWRVELDHELRDARLAPGGVSIELTVPPGARGRSLRLAFGVLGQPSRRMTFVVAPAEPVEGNAAAGLEGRFEVPPREASRWHDVTIGPMPDDRAHRLRLLVELAPRDHGGAAIPVWAGGTLTRDPARAGRGDPRPDIVLISVDTLRADRMSLYGAERPTTPWLDAWARRRAVVFDAAIAQASWTLPSHASMFSGLETHHHGALYTDPLSISVPLLAERLRDVGYETRAITGAGYLDPRYGLHRGFERYRSWGGVWSSPDEIEDGTSRALATLDEPRDRPLFLFFHTYDVHGPFRPHQPYFSQWSRYPPDWWVLSELVPDGEAPDGRDGGYRMMRFPPRLSRQRELLPEADVQLAYDLYDSGVASADEHVGRILERLRASGRENGTLVVFTSDHGEAIGEHGLAGHGFLYEDNIRVPLAVALPGGQGAGSRIAEQVRLIDLLPTLLDAAGTRSPSPVDGRSLLPWLRGVEAPSELPAATYSNWLGLSLRRDGRWKFLFWDGVQPDRAAKDRLFDLVADPAERVDRLAERDDRAGLESDALRHLADAAGLRVRIAASETVRPELELDAPWLEANRAKWISPPDPGLRWETSRGVVVDSGSAGERVLVFHVPGRENPTLRIAALGPTGDRSEVELPLRGGDLDRGPVAIVARGGGLDAIPGDRLGAGDRVLIELAWRGTLSPAGEDPAVKDPELERQLRALGYLN